MSFSEKADQRAKDRLQSIEGLKMNKNAIKNKLYKRHKHWHIFSLPYPSAGLDNWHTSHRYVCLLLLAYAWFWISVRWHICWHVHSFVPKTVWKLTYLLSLKERFFTVHICFKETLFFNLFSKLFNKFFSLPQSTCQFRVSVRK